MFIRYTNVKVHDSIPKINLHIKGIDTTKVQSQSFIVLASFNYNLLPIIPISNKKYGHVLSSISRLCNKKKKPNKQAVRFT